MAFFTVLTPPVGAGGPREAAVEAEVIKDGFSFAAFIFTGFWLLYKKLWGAFLLFALVYAVLLWLRGEMGLPGYTIAIAQLAIGLLIGHEATSLQERKRLGQGWQLADVIEAANLGHAERRFFERAVGAYAAPTLPVVSPVPSPAMSSPGAGRPQPIIGLFPEAMGR
jgi:Protein of unknown function (DUF2628)